MSILNVPTPSKAQAQSKVRGLIVGGIRNLYAKMLSEFSDDSALIWQNPDGLTPAEALEGLSIDGGEVFTLAGILKDALNSTFAPPIAVC